MYVCMWSIDSYDEKYVGVRAYSSGDMWRSVALARFLVDNAQTNSYKLINVNIFKYLLECSLIFYGEIIFFVMRESKISAFVDVIYTRQKKINF